jgi:hypothetical protein
MEYLVSTRWGDLLVFDSERRERRQRDEAVGLALDPGEVIVIRR